MPYMYPKNSTLTPNLQAVVALLGGVIKRLSKFEQPDEMGAYDRWELKLNKKDAPLFKEWADMMLFLNYKTTVALSNSGKAKATGGKRVVYATHSPCWDAKNRHGLPDEFDLDYEVLRNAIEGGTPNVD